MKMAVLLSYGIRTRLNVGRFQTLWHFTNFRHRLIIENTQFFITVFVTLTTLLSVVAVFVSSEKVKTAFSTSNFVIIFVDKKHLSVSCILSGFDLVVLISVYIMVVDSQDPGSVWKDSNRCMWYEVRWTQSVWHMCRFVHADIQVTLHISVLLLCDCWMALVLKVVIINSVYTAVKWKQCRCDPEVVSVHLHLRWQWRLYVLQPIVDTITVKMSLGFFGFRRFFRFRVIQQNTRSGKTIYQILIPPK